MPHFEPFNLLTIGPMTNPKSPLLPLSLDIVLLILPPTHQKALTLFPRVYFYFRQAPTWTILNLNKFN